MYKDFKRIICSLGFRTGCCHGLVGCKYYRHTSMSFYLRLAKYTHLHARFAENCLKIVKLNFIRIAFHHYRTRCRGAEEAYFGYRQPEKSAGMQSKFAELLRNHCNHSCIVRARRDFRENHMVVFNEKFNAENSISAKSICNFFGDILRLAQRLKMHALWLP